MSKAEFGVEFPEEYPPELRGISWTLETAKGGLMAGPMKRWNKNLSESEKNNPLFVENVIKDYFREQGQDPNKFDDLIFYVAKHLSVYYSQDCGEFFVREKTSGEDRFDEIKVNFMTGFENLRETRAFLNYVEKRIKNVYDEILNKFLGKK